jgi:hypothetical protein
MYRSFSVKAWPTRQKNMGEDLVYSQNNKAHIKGYAVDGSMFGLQILN